MNRPRHELLARAALALDEDGGSARRSLDDQVENLPHLRALPDDIGELVVPLLDALAEVAVLVHQPPLLHRVADHNQHFVVLERLGDVVERTRFHRRDRAPDRRVGGDDDHREVVVDALQLIERGDAAEARHHDVDDGRIERHRPGQLEALFAGGRQPHGVPLAREQRLEYLAHDLFVVHDEDHAGSGCGHRGPDTTFVRSRAGLRRHAAATA